MTNKKPLIGILIGAGHFAKIHLESWTRVQGAAIGGVMDCDPDKAQALGSNYGIPGFGNWHEAMKEVDPDFVDICTPPDSHFYYAKLAAEAGLPVLCQKPLAPSLDEGKRLIEYCEARNVPLMVNENWRWQPWYREIKQMISTGMLGEIHSCYFAMRPGDGWGPDPYPLQPYFKRMKKFLIFETGVHFIDTFRYLFGEIDTIYCSMKKVNPVIAGEDHAVIHFRFKSGMTAIYDANRVTYTRKTRPAAYGHMALEGTGGSLRLDPDGRIWYTPRGGEEVEQPYPIPDGWGGGCVTSALQHFINGLSQGTPFETSGRSYWSTFRIVFDCYDSAKKNQVVHVGD